MNATHALPLGLARAAIAGIALAAAAPAHADDYVELVALRADLGTGFTPLLFTAEMT
jgi:hypothetical protein